MELQFPEFFKKELPIRAFVTKKIIGVKSDCTVQEAAQKMVEFSISSLVVIENNRVTGFFTEGDFKKKVIAEGKSPKIPVKDIMNRDLITIDINAEFKDALKEMIDKHIKHLLVKEKNEIVGVLTFTDFLDVQRQKIETFISRE
ncbi:MAG: CBS domain-containing protein [Candidatus Mcinerneyibacterium aminivorans]|uniref:CBS domain-containing protein n=1 Tax=Candidatus Mcinerneyibacterium aminivorans TaxID=2703815 RepID=A0A5D0MIT3_9BACT|nr:MAG: CBS domain-containing protein [Candidatus Mcinerneyibacterium aminivorans]